MKIICGVNQFVVNFSFLVDWEMELFSLCVSECNVGHSCYLLVYMLRVVDGEVLMSLLERLLFRL